MHFNADTCTYNGVIPLSICYDKTQMGRIARNVFPWCPFKSVRKYTDTEIIKSNGHFNPNDQALHVE